MGQQNVEGAIFEQKGRARPRVCRAKTLRCPPSVTKSHVAWTEVEPGCEVEMALRSLQIGMELMSLQLRDETQVLRVEG